MATSRSASLLLIGVAFVIVTYVAHRQATRSYADSKFEAPEALVPATLFGMHIHRATTTTPWPSVAFGTLRLWDAGVDWASLEPEKGDWVFAKLDKYVDLAEQHDVEVLLTMALSPTWASSRPNEQSRYSPGRAAGPKNIEDWDDYVRTVATRYKGRILDYEIWNEPNLKGFFSGTPEQMVQLTREAHTILKDVDPSNIVVSPSATGEGGVPWLDRFLQLGGGKYVDVIGYHFYVEKPPEATLDLIAKVKTVMSRHGLEGEPLWDTELGWARPKPFPSEQEAAAYVARAYILHWAAGVSRLYWFAWDQQVFALQMVGADSRSVKPAGVAYAQVENWLIGARMISCESDSGGTWVCRISRDGGYRAWILWNVDRNLAFSIPRDWKAQDFRDLSGMKSGLKGENTLAISASPILVEKPASSK
jgi:Glycosyl hydrolase catalytic core